MYIKKKGFSVLQGQLTAYLKEFYSTAPERVRVITIREKCFTKATLAKSSHLDFVKEIFAALSETYICAYGWVYQGDPHTD